MKYASSGSADDADSFPPESLHAQIRARIAAAPAARTRTHTRVLWATIAALVVAVATVMISSELVYQRQAVGLTVEAARETRLAWTLLLLAAIAIAATVLAVRRGRTGLGIRAGPLAVATLLVVPLYAALTSIEPIHVREAAQTGVAMSPWGTRCAAIAGLVGATVMGSFAVALRRAVPVASRLRGAAIGAAAGAWAGLAVFVFCPAAIHQHLIAGHVLPVLGLVLLGLLLTPRLLRP